MDYQSVILQMAVLFLLILAGFIANKCGLMDAAFNKQLSALVLNLALPAMILSSVMGDERLLSNTEVFILMGISTLSYLVVIALSFLLPKALRVSGEDGDLYRFLLIFSNVGFMGFPVVTALYGEGAVFYASIFNMPFNLLMYSYGIKLASGGRAGGFNKKTLFSPCIICSVAALILYLIKIPFPAVVTKPLSYLGNITVPVAMLVIGSSLAMVPLKSIFRGWKIYAVSVLKLAVLPVLVYFALYFVPLNDIIRQVVVVMWAMPAATNATLIATRYGGNESLASRGVLITTLLSMVTIPVLMVVLFV